MSVFGMVYDICPNCNTNVKGYINPNGTCPYCGAVCDSKKYDAYQSEVVRQQAIAQALTALPNFSINAIECIAGYSNNLKMYIDKNSNIIYIGDADGVGLTPWLSKMGSPIRLDLDKKMFVDVISGLAPF